ncbi:MAG: FAD-binding protein, partial [Nonomuraea sp.]|nr:FAD-binding protein [Nonomuraea sp.]
MARLVRTDVLVAGGGMAGLSAALFLAWHGVSCVLVERRADTLVHPRARGLHARTVELLRGVGLEEAVAAAGASVATSYRILTVESLAGRELFAFPRPPEDDGLSPCRMSFCQQDRLEPLLRGRAETLGADIRFGVPLRSFAQSPGGVTARVGD